MVAVFWLAWRRSRREGVSGTGRIAEADVELAACKPTVAESCSHHLGYRRQDEHAVSDRAFVRCRAGEVGVDVDWIEVAAGAGISVNVVLVEGPGQGCNGRLVHVAGESTVARVV